MVTNSNTIRTSILLSAQTETATATATGLAVYGSGSHEVFASYPGDADRIASESDTVLLTAVPQIATETTLSVAPNPAFAGQAVTMTATVIPAPTGTPAGTVSFFNGNTLVGTGTVDSSGMASFTSSSLPTGSLSLTAVYSGNYRSAGSTSLAQNLAINPQTATTTVLQAAPNPSTAGAAVTLTATVSPAPAGTPAGTVSFFNGSTLLGTATLSGSGVASFTLSSFPSGTETVTAVYSGNASFATSTSIGLEVTVTSASTFSVTAPASSFTVNAGGSVDINITVPPIGGPFDSVVTMSASGLPAGATATFTPPMVTPGASGATTVLTIQTAAHTAALPRRAVAIPVPAGQSGGWLVRDGRTTKAYGQVRANASADDDVSGRDVAADGLQRRIRGIVPELPDYGHGYQRDPACFHYLHPHCEVRRNHP